MPTADRPGLVGRQPTLITSSLDSTVRAWSCPTAAAPRPVGAGRGGYGAEAEPRRPLGDHRRRPPRGPARRPARLLDSRRPPGRRTPGGSTWSDCCPTAATSSRLTATAAASSGTSGSSPWTPGLGGRVLRCQELIGGGRSTTARSPPCSGTARSGSSTRSGVAAGSWPPARPTVRIGGLARGRPLASGIPRRCGRRPQPPRNEETDTSLSPAAVAASRSRPAADWPSVTRRACGLMPPAPPQGAGGAADPPSSWTTPPRPGLLARRRYLAACSQDLGH